MRIQCPNCQKWIEIANNKSGSEAICEFCGKPFTAPELLLSPTTFIADPIIPISSGDAWVNNSPKDQPVEAGLVFTEMKSHAEPKSFVSTSEELTPIPIERSKRDTDTRVGEKENSSGRSKFRDHPNQGDNPRDKQSKTFVDSSSDTGSSKKQSPNLDILYGYSRLFTFSIPLKYLAWFPHCGILIIFVLGFFSWAGLFPGSKTAYSQNLYQILFGTFYSDSVSDSVFNLKESLELETHSSFWLLLYVILLLVSMFLIWANLIISKNNFPIPHSLEPIWEKRHLILVIITGSMFVILNLKYFSGFSLEDATIKIVNKEFQGKIDATKQQLELEKIQREISQKIVGYQFGTTFFFHAVILFHFIIFLVILLEPSWNKMTGRRQPRIAILW